MKLILNKEKLLELYDYYRDVLLPIIVIAICVVLVFFILIPQIASSFNNKAQYDLEKNTLRILNDNLSYVSALDSTSLEVDLANVTMAVPQQANFDSIVGSIYYAAAASGMSIGQFQFGVDQPAIDQIVPSVQLVVSTNSGPQEALSFIKVLYSVFPLSRVDSVKIEDKSREISIYFYHKPLLTTVGSNDLPIPRVTISDEEILKRLTTWKLPGGDLTPSANSTSSGSLGSDFPF